MVVTSEMQIETHGMIKDTRTSYVRGQAARQPGM